MRLTQEEIDFLSEPRLVLGGHRVSLRSLKAGKDIPLFDPTTRELRFITL